MPLLLLLLLRHKIFISFSSAVVYTLWWRQSFIAFERVAVTNYKWNTNNIVWGYYCYPLIASPIKTTNINLNIDIIAYNYGDCCCRLLLLHFDNVDYNVTQFLFAFFHSIFNLPSNEEEAFGVRKKLNKMFSNNLLKWREHTALCATLDAHSKTRSRELTHNVNWRRPLWME